MSAVQSRQRSFIKRLISLAAYSRRAAEQRDELASVHCAIPPVRSTERIAHLSYGRRLLRYRISIRPMSGSQAAVRVGPA